MPDSCGGQPGPIPSLCENSCSNKLESMCAFMTIVAHVVTTKPLASQGNTVTPADDGFVLLQDYQAIIAPSTGFGWLKSKREPGIWLTGYEVVNIGDR